MSSPATPPGPAAADAVFSVLCSLHAAFERHGIWHCLLFGTLLGAVRQGDIISWDHDLDLMIRPVDVSRVLALDEELALDGIQLSPETLMAGRLAANPGGAPWFDPSFLRITQGTAGCGEIYAPSVFDDGVLRFHDFEHEVIHWAHSSFPAFVVEELRTATVRGRPFPVPRYAEQLLEWHYGTDWRTPYRSTLDGGAERDDRTRHGDDATPHLAEAIRWCQEHGWDCERYRGQPRWPRDLRGGGPAEGSERTRLSSGSAWWHTLDELSQHH